MSLWLVRLCGLFFLGLLIVLGVATYQRMPAEYQAIQWSDLIAPDAAQPQALFAQVNLSGLSDSDPMAIEMLKEILLAWEKAPVNETIHNTAVSISGFIVPLEWVGDRLLSEFLLVPYFGACIHSPPPPANQIIYIKVEAPLKGIRSMEEVVVSGTLIIQRNDAATMGVSGYTIVPDKIKRYELW